MDLDKSFHPLWDIGRDPSFKKQNAGQCITFTWEK